MNKIFSGITSILLLIGMLSLAFNIRTVKAGTNTIPDNYPTIQAAINHALDGDTVVSFAWNTAGFTRTSYTIRAQVSQVPYEIDMSNNTYIDGVVKVTIPGDVDGDFFVTIKDATQIGLYWMQLVPPAPANANINDDGIVNIMDATLVGLNWLKHA